jgi:hypothetical protein
VIDYQALHRGALHRGELSSRWPLARCLPCLAGPASHAGWGAPAPPGWRRRPIANRRRRREVAQRGGAAPRRASSAPPGPQTTTRTPAQLAYTCVRWRGRWRLAYPPTHLPKTLPYGRDTDGVILVPDDGIPAQPHRAACPCLALCSCRVRADCCFARPCAPQCGEGTFTAPGAAGPCAHANCSAGEYDHDRAAASPCRPCMAGRCVSVESVS